MEEQYLTVKAVAELKMCTERYVRTLIGRGKLEGIETEGFSAGQGGIQYRIPLSSLDGKLQLKYKRLQRKQEKDSLQTEVTTPDDIPIDSQSLTASERDEAAFWKQLISEWRTYRNTCGLSKDAADDSYIKLVNVKYPDISLTRRTLYRKWNALNEKGEAVLADRRGKHGNHAKKLTPYMWDIFESFYLDESQKSVTLCMTLTKLELERQVKEKTLARLPELPKLDAFIREVNKIPVPYIEYFRHGLKSFIGKCEPYIKRIYEDLEPNSIWVADNHTFDIMLHDGEKVLRLYLTAFMDVRTRKITGWCVTDKPCADATVYALKKGVEKCGLPKMIYTDNGREFLFHDFGGNGFRKKKIPAEEFKPPTILKTIGIEFRTALPRNARAKGIERAFGTLADTFSRLFEAYTGGSVATRPERLKEVVKKPDKLKKVEEFTGFADIWIAGWYNKQPHTGEGMYGRSPDEAFAEMLIEKRTVTEEQLNLMFMRWSNPMKVGKNGVTLTFYEKKLQYFDKDLWINHFGKEVYVRYTPDDLREVRIYDTEERFICTAQLKDELSYNASKNDIADAQKETRSASKAVAGYKKLKAIKTHDELSLILDKAAENLSEGDNINPKYIRPLFGGEVMAKAAGYGDEAGEAINWTAALDNLKKQREEM